MPEYTYEHPKTKKQKVIFQTMKQDHVYTDKEGVQWKRVFELPHANIDSSSRIDPFSERDYMEKTKNKKMNIGEGWDLSAELSEKRTKKAGKDVIKEKAVNNYRRKTGKKHPHE